MYGEDDDAFDAAVREFLAGGVARGERLLCVGERVIESLDGGIAPLGDTDALIADGALSTLTLAEAYEATGTFTPEAQFAFYDEATRTAIADGYRGLRVVADVGGLAVDPGTRDVLIRWEHLADEYMAQGSGMSAMCTYHRGIPQAALAAATSVHPLVHAPEAPPPFQVFFDDDRVALVGSVDTFGADRLARVLASSPVSGDRAVLDLGRLEFVDVAGSRVIAHWAQDLDRRSLPLEVRGASPLLRRMWQVLGLGDVAAVRFAA
ncbi:STAS domain-containing protein [Blastococcus haudaquaticus]|uniref:STAS domain-containing protein n=1 Tax=Blastococcus haudaquaticus TaxID=1938745 RepID=A0A286GSM0_9ACTN|nr:STAS domain-containing protein [Blastococcus haudaquaticus]